MGKQLLPYLLGRVLMGLVASLVGPGNAIAETVPLWIDTDAACGSSELADADDCWALALALRSSTVVVRGISATTGAVKAGQAVILAREVAERFGYDGKVYQGAVRKNYRPTDASRALAVALEKERLTIVALGPLTNVAAVLLTRPKLTPQIERVIVVFGTPPDLAQNDNLYDYRNYNAAADTKAIAALMRAKVELVMVPLDAARSVVLTHAELDRVAETGKSAAWLAKLSRGWLRIWRDRIGEVGAFPAASAAVAYMTDPDVLSCRETKGQFIWKHSFFREKSLIKVGDDVEPGRPIVYCGAIEGGFRDRLLDVIAGRGGS